MATKRWSQYQATIEKKKKKVRTGTSFSNFQPWLRPWVPPRSENPGCAYVTRRNITKCRGWTSCNWTGLERLQQFLEAVTLDGHTVKTNVYRVTDASDVYRTLRQIDLRSRDGKTFIIDMTTRDTELLLRKIVSLSAHVHCALMSYTLFIYLLTYLTPL